MTYEKPHYNKKKKRSFVDIEYLVTGFAFTFMRFMWQTDLWLVSSKQGGRGRRRAHRER